MIVQSIFSLRANTLELVKMNYNFIDDNDILPKYDYVIIGSGFGSLFFLYGILEKASSNITVLIVERDQYVPHSKQVQMQKKW